MERGGNMVQTQMENKDVKSASLQKTKIIKRVLYFVLLAIVLIFAAYLIKWLDVLIKVNNSLKGFG